MKSGPNKLRRLSPSQILLIVAILLIFAIYQSQTSGASPAIQLNQGETPTEITPAAIPVTLAAAPTNTPNPARSATATLVTQKTPSIPAASKTPIASLTSSVDSMSSFDYFVLALLWSPDYCASNGGDDPQQCSIGKKLGFVLHGLWPQNNRGYPVNCSTQSMPQAVKNQYSGLYPNDALFDHEWEKHGTCTGLAPAAFLDLSRKVKNSVIIPAAYRSPETAFRTTVAQLRNEFAQANPTFKPAAFEVNCSGSGRYLKELYVCFSRSGSPIACGSEVHNDALKSCQSPDFVVRNTR